MRIAYARAPASSRSAPATRGERRGGYLLPGASGDGGYLLLGASGPSSAPRPRPGATSPDS